MIFKNTVEKYGAINKIFHWTMALIMTGLVLLGFYMAGLDFSPSKLSLYSWHKSFGTLVLFLAGLRLFWRFINKKPEALATHKKWEKTLAHAVHGVLYLLMILLPLSGWLMSSAGDFSHSFFGLFEMPDLVDKNEALFRQMREAHEIFVYLFLFVLGLHAAGAFKHHIIDRDITLVRMMPSMGAKCGAPVLLLLTALFFAGTGLLLWKAETKEHIEAPQQVVRAVQKEGTQTEGKQRWVIDKEQSSLSFFVTVYGEAFEGRFEGFDGTIIFDPENLEESRVDISVAMESASSGSDERDGYMRAQPWFFTESFPESQFEAKEFIKIDENQYVAKGFLTLRGVALPLDLPFSLLMTARDDGTVIAKMDAEAVINRLDFGVGNGEWSDVATVENQVNIRVSLVAHRTGTSP